MVHIHSSHPNLEVIMNVNRLYLSHYSSQINSWDPKQIQEPNYELRQEGFTQARQLLQSFSSKCHIQTKYILPLLQNAIYYVHEVIYYVHHLLFSHVILLCSHVTLLL